MQMKQIALLILSACAAWTVAAAPAEGGPAAEPERRKSATTAAGTATDTTTADDAATDAVSAAAAAVAPAEIPAAETRRKPFLPTRRRIDREIDKLKFVYKGEVIMGLTASYGTLSSDDTDFMLLLDNIDADGTIATVKPFIGYFYRDNRCLGVRFGYTHVGGTVNSAGLDLGASNDVSFDVPYLDLRSDNYSFGLFHRSYAGLDPKGRFGLFAEFELGVSTGTSHFAYESGGTIKRTSTDNTQVKLAFHPGAAVYIFPNVCATLSFGLGGIQYTSVTQRDADGNKIGSRKASNMKFKLNIAAINIGMTIHMWDKKKK
jgi:hypothetical protein